MPFQPVAATCLAELVYSLDGQTIENTLYFRKDNAWDESELFTLANELDAWWTAQMAPLLSTDISLIRVVCTALHAETGPQSILSLSPAPAGAVPTNAVPNNSAFCLSFRTALIGRSFRGRNYVPGLPESVVTISRLAAGTATAIIEAYELLNTAASSLNAYHVVVSRTVNGVVQMPTALTNAVNAYVAVDLVMDSQRRRLPGRGT